MNLRWNDGSKGLLIWHDHCDKNSGHTVDMPVDAASLVAYADGSVVSRTMINRDTGSVTLFAFDKGESLSEHTAPFDALIHILDGEAEITVGGVAHRVKAGQMILMPNRVPHAVKAVERFKMMLFLARVAGGKSDGANLSVSDERP